MKRSALNLAFGLFLPFFLYACASPLDVEKEASQKSEATAASGASTKNQLLSSLPAEYTKLGTSMPGGACAFDDNPQAGKQNTTISGWALIDAKTGAKPKEIILKLTESGSVNYYIVKPSSRPDVAKYFNNNTLLDTGFYAEIPNNLMGKINSIEILQVFDGKVYQCPTSKAFNS
jgi:hypothetical protein